MPFGITKQKLKKAPVSTATTKRNLRRSPASPSRPPSTGGATPRASAPSPATTPYNPSQSPYTTQQDFDNAVNSTAQNQIQPGLDDVASRERAAQSASDRRMQELRQWYDWAYQGNSSNAGAMQTAMNNAAVANAQGGQEAQDTLASALANRSGQQAGLVSALGGQSTDNGTDSALLAGNQQNQSALNALAQGNAQTYGAGAQGDLYTLQLAGIEAAKGEQARRAGLESGFSNERTQLNNSLGDLRTQARSTLDQQEQTRANQAFQQYLSEKEFNLSAKNQTFQQWLAKQNLNISQAAQEESERQGSSSRSLARANYGLDAARVANEAAKIEADAKGTGNKDNIANAKARADRMRNGATMFNEYIKPTKGDYTVDATTGKETTVVDPKRYNDRVGRLNFDDIYQQLRNQAGMGPIDALRMISTSLPQKFPNRARWIQRAKKLIQAEQLKRNPINTPTSVNGRPHG